MTITFLVNLDRSANRLKSIDEYLRSSGISYSRFSAIDGYQVTISSNETNRNCTGSYLKEHKLKTKINSSYHIDCNDAGNTSFNFNGVPMSAGQFGIWCSNLALWKQIIANNYNQSIIFQDDFYPINTSSFKETISNFTNSLPSDYDVAFMDFNHYVTRNNKLKEINKYISKPIENFMAWGMHAVLYSRKGIEKLLSYDHYSLPGDCFILDQSNKKQMEVYIPAINFINIKNFKSEIGLMGREEAVDDYFI